jgi:hypothetical protein
MVGFGSGSDGLDVSGRPADAQKQVCALPEFTFALRF